MSTPDPPGPPRPPDPDKPLDPLALLRSRSYIVLLVIAVIIGAPVSAAAYFFLALVSKLQGWVFTDLPKGVGFHAEPLWWPILPLLLAGVLVALTIKYLPGTGGHSPADGFKAGAGPPSPRELPGIVLAAFLPTRPAPASRARMQKFSHDPAHLLRAMEMVFRARRLRGDEAIGSG